MYPAAAAVGSSIARSSSSQQTPSRRRFNASYDAKNINFGGGGARVAKLQGVNDLTHGMKITRNHPKEKQEVVVEKFVYSKHKFVTTVTGLELFGVKLSDASKMLEKKFATRASVVKGPSEKEQIDVQGDIANKIAEFILETWPDESSVENEQGSPEISYQEKAAT